MQRQWVLELEKRGHLLRLNSACLTGLLPGGLPCGIPPLRSNF